MSGERRARRDHRRTVERLKNLFIVLLVCSAVYLVARTQLYGQLAQGKPGGWVGALLQMLPGRTGAEPDVREEDGRPSLAAHPVRVAIHNGHARYGVQYDQTQVEKVFDAGGGLLGECLASAKIPKSIPESQWRAALQQPGLYFDFQGAIPLDAIYAWLGEGQSNPNLTGTARRVLVARSGTDGVALYYSNESAGMYYACETSVTYAEHVEGVLSGFTANGAVFAFELEEAGGYGEIDPYVMILSTPPQPRQYHAGNPLAEDENRVDELERALSFRPQSNSVYSVPGGIGIREGKESLQIGNSGIITYHATEPEASRFPAGETSDVPGRIEAARRLVSATAGAWCGSAQIYLMDYTPMGDGSVELRFGYSLDGAAVQLYEEGYAAKFVIQDDKITDFTLCLRTYEDDGSRTVLLPERQAAAALLALEPEGRELTLCYEDSGGEQVHAGWVAR